MDQLTAGDPHQIGPYRLIARLGAGGMGLVYLGRSEAGRTVAVKVVQAEYAAQGEFRRRFAREVAAARRVGGSWTADVLDADTGADVPWVATQYVPGPSLAAVVAEDFGPLPEHSVRVLANRLALALQAVHGAGLIHRDLKPSNVLVTVDGPRLIDFGIVRAMDGLGGDSLLTRTGVLIGSPGFMSPEQVRGLELTPASDVFCLGAVLVHAATGRLLFGAADVSLNAHLFRIAEEEPDLTGVPASLDALVRACLDKDPTRRPTPAQISARTGGDEGGVWLPGEILAQLGRHAAQLLDYVPAPRSDAPEARTDTPAPAPPPPVRVPPPPPVPSRPSPAEVPAGAAAYTPTVPAHDVHAGTPASAPGATPDPSPRRRGGRAVVAAAQLAVMLGAVYGIWFATPAPSRHFFYRSPGFSAFAVAFAALLLPGGHLADIAGRRRTLAVGLVGLPAACLLGYASGMGSAPRILVPALQGGFGALVLAASLAVTADGSTGPQERSRTLGVYAWTGVGGSVAGLLIAQLAGTDVLLLVAAAAGLAALLGIPVLPRDPRGRTRVRFDPLGTLLGGLGPAVLLAGLGRPWLGPWMVSLSAAGLVLSVLFRWQQAAAKDPLLPSDAVRGRGRPGGLLVAALTGVGLLCLLPMLTGMVYRASGYSGPRACLPMLLMAAAAAVGAALVGPRLRRRGTSPRALAVAGLLTTVLGMGVGIVALGSGQSGTVLPVGTAVAGLGTGLAFLPLFSFAAGTAVSRRAGAVSGALLAAQFVGQGIGTSALYANPGVPPWWAAVCLLLAAVLAGVTLPAAVPVPGGAEAGAGR
ncbi:bifunctional serine/threonine protein kinase/MFS transporter [Kitasatospora sp. NPDC101157]|uniref:bifunctional serine/threonine protein kinase/MFS transporter n=1 Tax=Kitasatospora sp. NPDC101157 TaxID=3364098 RepID=UPI003824FEC9